MKDRACLRNHISSRRFGFSARHRVPAGSAPLRRDAPLHAALGDERSLRLATLFFEVTWLRRASSSPPRSSSPRARAAARPAPLSGSRRGKAQLPGRHLACSSPAVPPPFAKLSSPASDGWSTSRRFALAFFAVCCPVAFVKLREVRESRCVHCFGGGLALRRASSGRPSALKKLRSVSLERLGSDRRRLGNRRDRRSALTLDFTPKDYEPKFESLNSVGTNVTSFANRLPSLPSGVTETLTFVTRGRRREETRRITGSTASPEQRLRPTCVAAQDSCHVTFKTQRTWRRVVQVTDALEQKRGAPSLQ
ncbi:hypothetical protein MTO96_014951 [Rhipicephalus appendiculatus]